MPCAELSSRSTHWVPTGTHRRVIMTWKTSRGERVLRGAEAKLVAMAISTIVDFHRGEEGLCFGRKIIQAKFEELTEAEQFTVLEDIAIGLLTETSSVPQHTHINEGAIYYVFRWLAAMFNDPAVGVDLYGEFIVAAHRECFPMRDEDEHSSSRPSMDCFVKSDWKRWLEELADCVLWDRDFELFHLFGAGGVAESAPPRNHLADIMAMCGHQILQLQHAAAMSSAQASPAPQPTTDIGDHNPLAGAPPPDSVVGMMAQLGPIMQQMHSAPHYYSVPQAFARQGAKERLYELTSRIGCLVVE